MNNKAKKETNRKYLDVIRARVIEANKILNITIEYSIAMLKNCTKENQIMDLFAMIDKTDDDCKKQLMNKSFYNKTDELIAMERIVRHSHKDSELAVIAKRQLKIANVQM
jgi:hypothetical protein